MGLLDASPDQSVPVADAVTNSNVREVIGNKADTAQQTVVATASLVRYLKGLITALGNPVGGVLATITAKLGDGANSVLAVVGAWADAAVQAPGVGSSITSYVKGVLTTLGNPAADILTTITAKLGDGANANSILAVLGQLNTAAVQVVGVGSSIMAYVKGLINAVGNPTADVLTSLTAKLGNNSIAIGPQTDLQTGNEYLATYSLPSGVAESTAFDFNTQFAALAGKRVSSIGLFLDLTTLTQNATIRVKVAIDGANLRTIEALSWTTAMDDGVYFDLESSNINFSVTLQSGIAEGVARDIPVRVVFEQMEQ